MDFNKNSEKLNSENAVSKRTESPESKKEIVIGKKTLVFIVGLPGSGKSTFAINHFPAETIVSTDRIRQEISNNPANQLVSGKAFEIAKTLVEERLRRGEIAVVDAQNLSEDTRAQFYQAAEAHGARVEAIFLDVSAEESVERDHARKKNVGESYIKRRGSAHKTAEASLRRSKHVHAVHAIKSNEFDTVSVALPEDDAEALEADKELYKEAGVAEAMITAAETGFLRKEIPEELETIPLKAGSVLFLENEEGAGTKTFSKENFLPHQIIDAKNIARRIKTNITDRAVTDMMKNILRQRLWLNLTTVVSYPPNFPYTAELESAVKNNAEKRKLEIPVSFIRIVPDAQTQELPKELAESEKTGVAPLMTTINKNDAARFRVEVIRDAPQDSPLFIMGDIQGCYKAMRELSGEVRKENITKKKSGESEPKRTIVFVGDMADRGPYDAEAVIYITSLVRANRAILVKGNHDENLLRGLRGKEVNSEETRSTLQELKRRLKPASLQKIIEVLEKAPVVAQWKGVVVAHASLPRIPRPEEKFAESENDDEDEKGNKAHGERHQIIHGARSGRFVGGRAEVWKLHNTVAHDPDVLIVGGHTHEEEPITDLIAGTTILDANAEIKGKLWGMYYPELEFASAEEPSVLKKYEILTGKELPRGQELLAFIEYARQQGFIEIKHGTGEYEGLILTTYSGITEACNAWEKYPVLREFRGLIIDTKGNIVARPFEKTHKAGDEIPLDKLEIPPEKVFEKANGSLGIVYFWKEKWRVATKFSFESEEYTKPVYEMLGRMDTSALDQAKTHLFEIILPNDSHIVDYGGKQDLVFLNSIIPETGEPADWDEVGKTARKLGTRTARDVTADFPNKTIADIYRMLQQEGSAANLEGVMAQYSDTEGKKVLVKVKTREYDDKKFVRDRLDWKDILESFDPKTMEVPPENLEKLLSYNFDNAFARATLEARIQWIKEQYREIARQTLEFLSSPKGEADRIFQEKISRGIDPKRALEESLRIAAANLKELLKDYSGEAFKNEMGALMGFLRGIMSDKEKPEARLIGHAFAKIQKMIEQEKKKKGKNSFWIVPQ